ncbi:MAG: Rap1a/Tai family immunity protein [Myxococcota bacterium]
MRRAIPVVFLLALLASGRAGAYTGNELLSACEDREGSFGDGFCLGYIVANLQIQRSFGMRCTLPVQHEHPQGIVVKWLKDHPAALDLRASHLIALAYDDAFPCEESAQPPASPPAD